MRGESDFYDKLPRWDVVSEIPVPLTHNDFNHLKSGSVCSSDKKVLGKLDEIAQKVGGHAFLQVDFEDHAKDAEFNGAGTMEGVIIDDDGRIQFHSEVALYLRAGHHALSKVGATNVARADITVTRPHDGF